MTSLPTSPSLAQTDKDSSKPEPYLSVVSYIVSSYKSFFAISNTQQPFIVLLFGGPPVASNKDLQPSPSTMSTKLSVSELIHRNKKIAPRHEPLPHFSEMQSAGLTPPGIVVLTCADPRCNPQHYLDLQPMDPVILIRNVCGHVSTALKDILALDMLVGGLSDLVIVQHTDCGASHMTDDAVRAYLKGIAPDDGEIDSMTFGAITDIAQSVRDEMALFRSSPLVRQELKDHVWGFVYDIKTGELGSV